MTVPIDTESCYLLPVNLNDPAEFEIFRQQRVACGWNFEASHIIAWRKMIHDGLKSLFWITLHDNIRAGHISLDSDSGRDSSGDQIDSELARPDRTIMTISTFFILPEYRAGGLGRKSMDMLEDYATRKPYGSPHCRAVTLHTLSRRYFEVDSYEWKGVWSRMGLEIPRDVEAWYIRRGYVRWKEEPKYKVKTKDGTEIMLIGSFLKKELSLVNTTSRIYNDAASAKS